MAVRQTEGHKYGEHLSDNLELQIRRKKKKKEPERETVIGGSYARTGGPKTPLRPMICIRSTEVLMKDKPTDCTARGIGRGYQIKTHQIKAMMCNRHTEHVNKDEHGSVCGEQYDDNTMAKRNACWTVDDIALALSRGRRRTTHSEIIAPRNVFSVHNLKLHPTRRTPCCLQ